MKHIVLFLSLSLIIGFFPQGIPLGADSINGGSDILGDKVFFFGHQSVGANVLTGIEELQESGLSIVELGQEEPPSGGIVHKFIGRNEFPNEKISDFQSTLLNWSFGREPDIAMMKFCYVDINAETNVENLFEEYREAVERIAEEKPNLMLLHSTAPLVNGDGSGKAFVKRILGREPYAYADNLARERYNELVRAEYAGTGLLFDLAKIESTKPGGERSSFNSNGSTGFSLWPEYASDNAGHLNAEGRKRTAQGLIDQLARIGL